MTDRNQLLRALNLARPALATTTYILAMTHFRLDDGMVEAYNEINAISVKLDTGLECCLPGDLLIKTLNSLGGTDVMIQDHPKEKAVVVVSGRSRIKVPKLDAADLPLKWPVVAATATIVITEEMLTGITRCLAGAGNNPTHPAQMGVTLDMDRADNAVLYSTDYNTISAYYTKSRIKLPGDAPVIMPTFFCEQLLAMAKAFADEELVLFVMNGALLLEVGEYGARVFSRTLVDVQPLDFPDRIAKHRPTVAHKDMDNIPGGWDDAFSRAMLVMDKEPDKVTHITVTSTGLELLTKSGMGEVVDNLEYKGTLAKPVHLDPTMVIRGSKSVSKLAFGRDTLLLEDDDGKFMHLIAYCHA